MSRDFVKELRGDTRGEAIDIYNHIDKKELKESYLAHIPQLGIWLNVIELSKFAKYAQILKNSVASKETASARVSLMKDRAAVDGAMGFCINM